MSSGKVVVGEFDLVLIKCDDSGPIVIVYDIQCVMIHEIPDMNLSLALSMI